MAIYKDLSDNDLAGLLKSGDERAYVEIYERYWGKLYTLARNRIGDSCEAEEIVQDIFYSLWRSRKSFELLKGFQNYFSVAVKFGVINKLAKKAKRAAFEKEIAHTSTEADESTLQYINGRDLKHRIQTSIDNLPEKCALVFNLKYAHDYSQRHIAEELAISEKTVEAHLSRARKKLRSEFLNVVLLLGSIIYLFV
jgi:RNA polymerase sigma-70 factor (family 1)